MRAHVLLNLLNKEKKYKKKHLFRTELYIYLIKHEREC